MEKTQVNNFLKIDFTEHNKMVEQLWKDYRAEKPTRVPMILGMNPRMLLLDPAVNFEKITFFNYMHDSAIMAKVQLQFQYWHRHNMIQDREMGIPSQGWNLWADGQNVWDFEWLGAKGCYPDDSEPYVLPVITSDNKNECLRSPLPKPLDGTMARAWDYFDKFRKLKASGFTYMGVPIGEITVPGLNVEGPFTLAFGLMGEQIMIEMLTDKKFFNALMERITLAAINRVKFSRTEADWKDENPLCMTDDSICMLSVEHYEEFVLPYHKMIINELASPDVRNYIHLCGDASRHFLKIRDELNVYSFDTGFPIDFAKIREILGEEVEIAGGVHVNILKEGSPEKVYEETKKILQSGIKKGGRFFLRDANNLAPKTPAENIKAMYQANLKYGRYDS